MSRGFLAANRRNPTNSYENYIEMGRAIDYHILEMLSGNVDTMVLSAYFHKPRNQKLIFGPHWDFDRALGSTDGRDSNPRSWTCGPVFAGWYGQLFQDTEAWQRWVDRFQHLRTHQLSVRYTGMLMDRLANQIRLAERRDYQRWKIPRRGGSYQAELDSMNAGCPTASTLWIGNSRNRPFPRWIQASSRWAPRSPCPWVPTPAPVRPFGTPSMARTPERSEPLTVRPAPSCTQGRSRSPARSA